MMRGAEIRVLLVEDTPLHAAMARQMLESGDRPRFAVSQVGSLGEALAALPQRPFDVVLLDLGLPDASGIEAVERLVADAPHLPLVVMTVLDDEAAAGSALEAGAQDYLIKGASDREDMVRAIRYAIERHRQRLRMTEHMEALRKLSLVDPLTGLLNRRGFERALLREVEAQRRRGEGLMALLVDLDDFKQINDQLGHDVGDLVLRTAAARISSAVREGDEVSRVGGDEFLVLLPSIDQEEALAVAERIRREIAAAKVPAGATQVGMTGSLALTPVDPETMSIAQVLHAAHAALERGKRSGKNRVAGPGGVSPAAAPTEVADILQAALRGHGLEVHAQEIISVRAGVIGLELLIRGPEGPLRDPQELFRVAREQQSETALDLACLRRALASVGGHRSPAGPAISDRPLRFHLNVLPATLLQIPTSELLGLFPQANGGRWVVELAETRLLDPEALAPIASELRAEGIMLGIEDVGAGRSRLESLVLLRPTILKVDRSLGSGLGGSHERRSRLWRLLGVLQATGADVILQGVETESDLAAALDLGLEFIQGFRFGRPRPLAEVVRDLRS